MKFVGGKFSRVFLIIEKVVMEKRFVLIISSLIRDGSFRRRGNKVFSLVKIIKFFFFISIGN